MKVTPRNDKYAAMFTIASETEADKAVIEHFLAHANGKKIHVHSSGGTSRAQGHSESSFTIGLVDKGDFEAKPAPTFEAGKRYRTRDGRLTEPLAVRTTGSYRLQAKVERDPECDWRSWTAEGKWLEHTYNNPLDLMPGAIDDQPKFEHGKTYRTAGGHVMKARFVGDHKPQLFGMEQDEFGNRATESLVTIAYKLDGTTCGIGWEAYQLLPGAIEDENRTAEGIASGQDDGHVQDDGYVEIDKSRIAERERLSDLRQIHSRINRLVERVEGLEKAAEAMPGPYAMGQLKDRIAELENYTGLDVRAAKPHGPGLSPPFKSVVDWEVRDAPKPTIKGGWVNVWAKEFRGYVLGPEPFETKEAADKAAAGDGGSRIACIHIPDFTEGEGL